LVAKRTYILLDGHVSEAMKFAISCLRSWTFAKAR